MHKQGPLLLCLAMVASILWSASGASPRRRSRVKMIRPKSSKSPATKTTWKRPLVNVPDSLPFTASSSGSSSSDEDAENPIFLPFTSSTSSSSASSSSSSEGLPSLTRRYSRLVVFGDSYSDSQSPHAVFSKWQDRDKAWPEYLKRHLGGTKLNNYAISGAKSGRKSNVLGHTGGIFVQVDRFLDEYDPKRVFRPYPSGTLIAWEVGGINDFLFGPKDLSDTVYRNFKTTLNRIAGLKHRSDYMDMLVMPLTQAQHMPWHLKWGAHHFRKDQVTRMYKKTAKRQMDYLEARCEKLKKKGLRLWVLDPFELDESMRQHFRESRRPLLGNEWRVWNKELRRSDFMWYDTIHWSDAANRFVARRMEELLEDEPMC